MTIAAGFSCDDGVVLCADTQLTSTYKQQGQKLWLHEGTTSSVAVTGAGDYVLLKLANDTIRERITSRMSLDRIIHDVVEHVVRSIHEDHIDRAPDWKIQSGYDLYLIFAVKTAGAGVKLYETSRTSVAEIRDYRCVGAGAPVGNYIAATLFSPTLSVFWCAALAAYLIQQTKTYGLDCGGDSTLVVIPKEGPAHILPVTNLERVGNRIHEAIGPVLFSVASGWPDNEAFVAAIEAFQNAVRESHSDMVSEMSAFWRTPAARRFFRQEIQREEKQGRKYPKRKLIDLLTSQE